MSQTCTCICAHISHPTFAWKPFTLPASPHSLNSVASCWPTKALRLPTSQHISACKLFATFFNQVSAVTAPLSLLASRLQRVSGSKHEHVQRYLISVPVNWCVSCTEKDKTIWKNAKVVSACHVGVRLHVGQDDWLKHGICIWLWQLIWTFVLFVSGNICTVKKQCRNRKLTENCQTFASICLVAARYISPRRSAYKNTVSNRRVQGLRHNKL